MSRILSEAEKLRATGENLQAANDKLALVRTLARDILMEYDSEGCGGSGSTSNGQWKALREISRVVDYSSQAIRARVVQTSQHSESPKELGSRPVCPSCVEKDATIKRLASVLTAVQEKAEWWVCASEVVNLTQAAHTLHTMIVTMLGDTALPICHDCAAVTSKRDTAISALKMLLGWMNISGICLPDGIKKLLERICDGEIGMVPCINCVKLRNALQHMKKRMDFFDEGFLLDNYHELQIGLRRILEEFDDVNNDDQDH